MPQLLQIGLFNDFSRQSKQYARRLAKTGQPAVLMVDGKTKLIIQDAAAYQRLIRRARLVQSAAVLKRRLRASRGSNSISLDDWNNAMRRKYRIGTPK